MRDKVNKILNFFIHTDRGNIVFIVGTALMLFLLWSALLGRIEKITDDTATYFLAGEMFLRGDIDYLRTPVYPLICQAFLHCFGNSVFEALAILNIIVFLISIVFLYRTIALFTQRRIAKVITTVLYAWSTPLYEVCMFIMTESINLCGIIILSYWLSLIYVGKGKARLMWSVSAILLFLIFLRPFNIIFIPITLLVALAAYRKGRFSHLPTIGISLSVVLAVVFGYCLWFYNVYGTFRLSYVSAINRFYVLENFIDNVKIRNSATETLVTVGNRVCVVWMWHNRDSGLEYISLAKLEEHKKYAHSQIEFFNKTCHNLFPHADSVMTTIYSGCVQCLHLGTIYVVLALLFVLQLYLWFTNRRHCVDVVTMHILICAIVISTTILGSAHFDAPRLMMPMFPSLCLLVGLMFEQFGIKMKRSIPSQSNF